ncbi:DUF4037 domain-containing protein [Paenibacillus chondroitinus]|uniref:DUF4037 domain-containing protein n=1 Tax=Paenibacillus chondroitinus TaxID=59842 RepID=A0ABU6DR23_9BACL|nr:DUF4037 domain-containing protein [Paenibacillus chondroitinus]MCY9663095.1 DUF4037 domain-containing protein [Paenibacillus anseongense]MEB4799232.1 DUF4037 domain-containing protein [Paenibacillus chondroitinus]
MSDHIPGIQLSRLFHEHYVAPRLSAAMQTLLYASALVGPGSEVLGFDTSMSCDHDWGPRVLIFIRESDISQKEAILAALQYEVPASFYNYPIEINQTVVTTVPSYYGSRLGVSPTKLFEGLDPVDWLTFSSQTLAELSGGAIYRDDIVELTTAHESLRYYPKDVWLFLMASVWNRIGQEEHLMPRAGFVGDELGSSLVASRLVRDVMSLCFLIERRYAPYPKWFGTAFRQLTCSSEMLPHLQKAQNTSEWRVREQAFAKAYQIVAQMHNELQLTEPLDTTVKLFYDRPFSVIGGGRFAEALVSEIEDPMLRKLAAFGFGGIDQISDNTDFRAISERFQAATGEINPLRAFFDRLGNERDQ